MPHTRRAATDVSLLDELLWGKCSSNKLMSYNNIDAVPNFRKMQLQNSDEEGAGHFRLTLRIVVADDEFTYRTDVWELLKWAAVQYVTALLVVNYLLSGFLSSLFRNRLIEAVSCCNPLQ
ncbi:unnamed protein product [Heligmosomoides polygyrus]|uniref:Transmembrane protein 231 n=1 Tax=Heligmosomoides polygyrus TaxID=6339 RepID=A0A3P8CG10_HELPZ|nr:unnamed protein product [Heligmosomoides polygyrus]